MLHILWLILKMILILLGVLLGLVLLLVLLLLFCPVRYRGRGRKDGEWKDAEGELGVSWLFRGISVTASRKNGENRVYVRVLGISVEKLKAWLEKRKEKKRKKAAEKKAVEKPDRDRTHKKALSGEGSSRNSIEEVSEEEGAFLEEPPEPEKIPESEENLGPEETPGLEEISESEETPGPEETPESEETPGLEKIPESEKNPGPEETPESEKIPEPMEIPEQEGASAEEASFGEDRVPERETAKKKGLFWRISEKLSEIRDKIKNIRLTFNRIHDKIDWWKNYIHHPRVKAAASLVWRYAKGLLKHILPTKVWGKVTFGFSDPSVTGRVLGLLGMSFPLHKNCVAVTPRFDGETILEGEICLKGRIYGIVLLKAAVVIYFNKNVKYAIKRAKHGKHKED